MGKLKYLLNIFLHYSLDPFLVWKVLTRQPVHEVRLSSGVRVSGNATSQVLEVCEENFFKKVYYFGPVSISPGDLVVDIGANIGSTTVFAKTEGAAKVYAYEPFPNNILAIKKNVQQNHLKGVTVVQSAVSGKVEKSKLYIGFVDTGNLLFDHNVNGKMSEYIEVPTTTLEQIFKDQKLDHVDFLKLDCEGSEGDILKTTPDKIWKKINKIGMEFHDNVSSLSHEEIEKKLHQMGFQTHLQYDGKTPFGYLYAWRKI